ncbi:HYR domain-containing protein [Mariprofundus ferrooxydans]|uniref:HYR domain-containing protein n=1 Tax=Mariprofundus ferrooxydans TaxID=314344 RepID=UPI0039BF84A7
MLTSTSQATVSIGTATATDNVDGIVAVTNNAPATYPIGVTTVTYTSSDLAGNAATERGVRTRFAHFSGGLDDSTQL